MGNYTIFQMFENPRRGRQTRHFTTNVPKILDRKSSSEQIFFRKLTLGVPEFFTRLYDSKKLNLNSFKVKVELKTLGILTSDRSQFVKLAHKLMTFIRLVSETNANRFVQSKG